MDRKTFALLLSDRTGLPLKDVRRVIRELPGAVVDVLRDGQHVTIKEFGVFSARRLKAGEIRLPNGARHRVSERRKLVFRATPSISAKLGPGTRTPRRGRS